MAKGDPMGGSSTVRRSMNGRRIETDDILAAIHLHLLHQFHFWDCLILRAALRSGCSVLFSEDLQSGRKIEGLEIVNPFV
jgi:predicted nucleic acid-binding protein